MGWFDGWFGGRDERNIPKLDDAKKDTTRDVLDISNLDGYNIVESNFAVNTINDGLLVMSEQANLIDEYRTMALYPLVDDAIDDVVNAIVSCDSDEAPVTIKLEAFDDKKAIQEKIQTSFDKVVRLVGFDRNSYEIVRGWYTDGSLALHPIVDDKKKNVGIQRVVHLDPRGLQKINKIKVTKDPSNVDRVDEIEEFYIYDVSRLKNGLRKSQSVFTTQDILKISKNAMVVCTSGLYSADGTQTLSDLEKSRKVLNDVKNMENAMVIYRLGRATERKAFYIDTGTLPAKAATAYLQEVMNKHRSGVVEYDAATGKVTTGKTNLAITDDYWLPRREGGRGTEIATVEGAANLNDIDDILLMQKKLVKSLNVPGSRLNEDASLVLGNRAAEVNREEWKFQKFIERKRRQFSSVFSDLLRIELVLTGVCTDEEWDTDILPHVGYEYASDLYQKEQQELEDFAQRINILNDVAPLVGDYFARTTVERIVLGRTDEDMTEEDKRIASDVKSGKIKQEDQDEI